MSSTQRGPAGDACGCTHLPKRNKARGKHASGREGTNEDERITLPLRGQDVVRVRLHPHLTPLYGNIKEWEASALHRGRCGLLWALHAFTGLWRPDILGFRLVRSGFLGALVPSLLRRTHDDTRFYGERALRSCPAPALRRSPLRSVVSAVTFDCLIPRQKRRQPNLRRVEARLHKPVRQPAQQRGGGWISHALTSAPQR